MPLRVTFGVVLALALVGGAGSTPARAQPGGLADEATLAKFDTSEKRVAFFALLRGEQPLTKAEVPLVELAAKYYVQRLALLGKQKNTKELRAFAEAFELAVREARPEANKSEARKEFLSLFSKELVKSFKQVLALDFKQWRPGILHAGLMLEPLGRLGQPEAGDFLAEQARSAKHDVLKLYAFKGLREYFRARPPKVFSFTNDDVRLAEARRIEPVLAFVTTAPAKTAGMAPEERDAFHFIRREAIKALAETRLPGVPLLSGKEVKAPVALVLARVLTTGKDALTPEPTLSEKLEAAIGLCQLKAEVSPKPDADLLVGLVGRALVECAGQYQADQVTFAQKGQKDGKLPFLPWRLYAERLRLGLGELKGNVSGSPGAAGRLAVVERAAGPLLELMKAHRGVESLQALQQAVAALPRPKGNVYEGLPQPQIDVGAWQSPEG